MEIKKILLTGFAGLALAACSSQAEIKRPSAEAPWLSVGQAANGYQKPGAPLSVSYQNDLILQAGDRAVIPVRIQLHADVDALMLTLSDEPPLGLVSAAELNWYELKRGDQLETQVQLVAHHDGAAALRLQLVTRQGDRNLARVMSIPFVFGDVSASSKQEPTAIDAEGRRIQNTIIEAN